MYPINYMYPQHMYLNPIQKVSLRKRLIKKFYDWLESSSSHGLPNIVRTKRISLKILWLGFFVGSLGACVYFFLVTMISYFQYDTVVQISVIQENPVKFPAVTFCNLNPFNLKTAENNDYITKLLQQTNNSIINEDNDNTFSNTNDILYDATDSIKRLITNDTSTWYKKNIGFDINDMLVSCSFNREPCSNFTPFLSYDHGNCFTYNNDYKKTSKIGSNYGLQLELIIGNPSIPIKYTPNTGIYLIVHNETKKSETLGDGDGIFISPGYDTIVSVKREFRFKEGSPFSNCIKDLGVKNSLKTTKYVDYLMSFNFTNYDQGFCYKICYQDYLINVCGCSDARYKKLQNSVYCLDKTQLDCMKEVEKYFSFNIIDQICDEGCPIQCDTIKYQLSTSMAEYPTIYYSDFLKSKSKYFSNYDTTDQKLDQIRKYLLKVTVTYSELEYMLVKEVPAITPDSLIGTIGGQFGLFIGISLLSIVELVEIIIELFLLYVQNKN